MAEVDILSDELTEEQKAEQARQEAERSQKEKESKELILGRFKSQDELAKAYQEAEAKMTQEAQKRAEYERRLQELEAVRQQQTPPPQEEDINELFWREPARAVEKVFAKMVDPLVEDRYEATKANLRANDPDFAMYEANLDTLVRQKPELRTARGGVEQAYKMVKGFMFDPVSYERKLREKWEAERSGKIGGSLEGASHTPPIGSTTQVSLSDEEKKVAIRFYDDVPPEQAIAKYADAKARKERGEI